MSEIPRQYPPMPDRPTPTPRLLIVFVTVTPILLMGVVIWVGCHA